MATQEEITNWMIKVVITPDPIDVYCKKNGKSVKQYDRLRLTDEDLPSDQSLIIVQHLYNSLKDGPQEVNLLPILPSVDEICLLADAHNVPIGQYMGEQGPAFRAVMLYGIPYRHID